MNPAVLNVVERARRFLGAFEDLCAAFSKTRAAAEYLREALEADEVKHRPRRFRPVCQRCFKVFEAHRATALYCSDVCRQAARAARRASDEFTRNVVNDALGKKAAAQFRAKLKGKRT